MPNPPIMEYIFEDIEYDPLRDCVTDYMVLHREALRLTRLELWELDPAKSDEADRLALEQARERANDDDAKRKQPRD